MEEKFSFFEIQQKNQKARAGSFKSNVIEVKSWLILLDTYSYVNVHHCKAIEVKSWLILLDTYSYTYMFIIARRSKSNLGSFYWIHTRT